MWAGKRGLILKSDTANHKKFRNTCVHGLLFAVFILYPVLSKKCFQLLKCRELPSGWFLVADMSLECFTPEWYSMAAVGAAGVLTVSLGVPLLFTFLLWRKYKAGKLSDEDCQQR